MADDKIINPEKKNGFFDWLMKHSKKIMLMVIILSLVASGSLIGVVLYSKATTDSNVLATVGDEKITKADMNERIYGLYFEGTPASPTTEVSSDDRKEYLQELINYKIADIEAKKFGISVTNEEVVERAKEKTYSYDTQSAEQQKITQKFIRYNLTLDKLKEKVLGWKEGSYVMVNFTKNFSSAMDATAEQKKQDDATREAKVKDDTEYATNLINTIYADIQSGKITFEEGMERAKNDPHFGIEGVKPYSTLQSDSFTKEDYMSGYKVFQNKDLKQKFSEVKSGQVSKPFAINVPVTNSEGSPVTEREGMWVIAKIDGGGDALADSFNDWLSHQAEELEVKILNKEYALSGDEKNKIGHLLLGEAEAHSGAHNCTMTDHFGINTGNNGNSAGLVVTTGYTDASGTFHFTNRNVAVQGTGGGILWTPGGAWDGSAGALNKIFATGSGYSYAGGNCSLSGYLVLGWGTTSSSYNGHYGNGNSLSCDHNPFTVWLADPSGYGSYGGQWYARVNNGAWMASHGTGWFNVLNGWTTWVNFSYTVAPQPVCDFISVRKDSSTGTVLAEGETIQDGTTSCVGWGTTDASNVKYEALRNGQVYYTEPTTSADNNYNTCSVRGSVNNALTEYMFKLTSTNWAGVSTTCQRSIKVQPKNCPPGGCPESNICPTLDVSPTSVKQGKPVTLSWGGGNNVKSINIKQKPAGSDPTLATVFYPIAEGTSKINGGTLEMVPSASMDYILEATFKSGAPATCATAYVPVTVNSVQSGSDRPVPPN